MQTRCCGLRADSLTLIPVTRVLDKLDRYLAKKDFANAERHLKYWLDEAKIKNDIRGEYAVCNELVGFYRKQGDKKNGLEFCDAVLRLTTAPVLADTVGCATGYLNTATAYKSFGMPDRAIELYEKARAIYEKTLDKDDDRFGGLYNNMALALCDLKRYDRAREMYGKAVSIMSNKENGMLETAITYINMAELEENALGAEKAEGIIEKYLGEAEKYLFDGKVVKDGYCAYVYECCAPSFRYYGYFPVAQRLEKTANEIRQSIKE